MNNFLLGTGQLPGLFTAHRHHHVRVFPTPLQQALGERCAHEIELHRDGRRSPRLTAERAFPSANAIKGLKAEPVEAQQYILAL